MFSPALDAKTLLAFSVVIGCFAMLGLYVLLDRAPEGYIIAIVASSLSGVLSYFFGHSNGTNSALAATALESLGRARELVATQFPPPNVPPTP